MGFPALATSSAALAFSRGLVDSPCTLDLATALANLREIVQATDLPVTADFQNAYGETPEAVAQNVTKCLETGIAGLSIEDATGDSKQPLFGLSESLERFQAARSVIDESGLEVVLTARAEAFLVGAPRPLETVIKRLVAFAEAGADCLFAPGLCTPGEVAEVVRAVAPKPVNVLASAHDWMTQESLAKLGVRRISVGSALARSAWRSFLTAAREIAATGSFQPLADAEPFENLDRLFSK
jgi:2-methylisocitrate lyase-like PEP mutase family enzyme